MARKGFAYYAIGRGLAEPPAAGPSRARSLGRVRARSRAGIVGGLTPLRVLVTGAAGFIGFHVARRLLARGDAVTGFDNLNDYYDPALKEARLAELDRQAEPRPATGRFRRADLADRAAVEAAFAEAGPFDRVIHLAAQAGVRYSLENPGAYVESNLTGFTHLLEACRRGADPAPGLRLDLERLRRQHRDAVLRGPGGRPPAAVLRRDQAGERADGARLRPPLRPALHRPALLHRLRPLGPARHGADDLRRRDQRGPADPALQRRPAQPRLHLRRRHRRGRGPRRRRRRHARPGLGPGRPRPRHLVGAVPDLQHRQRRAGRAARLHRRARAALGRRAIREHLPPQPGDVPDTWADCARLEAATGWRPATPVAEGVARFVAWYKDYTGRP